MIIRFIFSQTFGHKYSTKVIYKAHLYQPEQKKNKWIKGDFSNCTSKILNAVIHNGIHFKLKNSMHPKMIYLKKKRLKKHVKLL